MYSVYKTNVKIRIQKLEDEHDDAKAKSKTAHLLEIIYNSNDKNEMKDIFIHYLFFIHLKKNKTKNIVHLNF